MNVGVKVQNVSKTFHSKGREISPLQGLNLEIKPGELGSVIGKSGCGKTTLLKMIAGFDKPDSGEILFYDEKGNPIKKPKLSVVFQDPRLLPWKTVRENLELPIRYLPPAEREKKIDEALTLVRLHGVKESFPYELSGGMAQRVGLARGIISQPDILLMDEPFSALDAITRSQLQADFSKICRELNTTILLITHDIGEAVFLSDEVFFMKDGKVRQHFPIDIPFPRTMGDSKLGEIQQNLFKFVIDEKNEI